MNTPNWQHHSKKDAKRKLKPQALRAAKERRRQLINRLLKNPSTKRGFFINNNKNATPTREIHSGCQEERICG